MIFKKLKRTAVIMAVLFYRNYDVLSLASDLKYYSVVWDINDTMEIGRIILIIIEIISEYLPYEKQIYIRYDMINLGYIMDIINKTG